MTNDFTWYVVRTATRRELDLGDLMRSAGVGEGGRGR